MVTQALDQFEVESGSCTTSGKCFQSPNYPNNYGFDQTCSIKVLSVGSGEKLETVAFYTEQDYDMLTINGIEYSGTAGPGGVVVSAGDNMTWSSDGADNELGFQVCLAVLCTETNGATLNSGPCLCGAMQCMAESGLFCYADGSKCAASALTMCAIQNNSATNIADCWCGSEECTASSGLFCYTPLNLCKQTSATLPVPDSVFGGQGETDRSIGLCKVVDDWINTDPRLGNTRSSIESIYGLIQDWDLSGVTSMDNLFDNSGYSTYTFDADLSKWNVSHVTSMRSSTSSLFFLG
jgi:hypothetical protein